MFFLCFLFVQGCCLICFFTVVVLFKRILLLNKCFLGDARALVLGAVVEALLSGRLPLVQLSPLECKRSGLEAARKMFLQLFGFASLRVR